MRAGVSQNLTVRLSKIPVLILAASISVFVGDRIIFRGIGFRRPHHFRAQNTVSFRANRFSEAASFRAPFTSSANREPGRTGERSGGCFLHMQDIRIKNFLTIWYLLAAGKNYSKHAFSFFLRFKRRQVLTILMRKKTQKDHVLIRGPDYDICPLLFKCPHTGTNSGS